MEAGESIKNLLKLNFLRKSVRKRGFVYCRELFSRNVQAWITKPFLSVPAGSFYINHGSLSTNASEC